MYIFTSELLSKCFLRQALYNLIKHVHWFQCYARISFNFRILFMKHKQECSWRDFCVCLFATDTIQACRSKLWGSCEELAVPSIPGWNLQNVEFNCGSVEVVNPSILLEKLALKIDKYKIFIQLKHDLP